MGLNVSWERFYIEAEFFLKTGFFSIYSIISQCTELIPSNDTELVLFYFKYDGYLGWANIKKIVSLVAKFGNFH